MSLNQHSNPVFQWEDESGYEVLPGIAKQQCKLSVKQNVHCYVNQSFSKEKQPVGLELGARALC